MTNSTSTECAGFKRYRQRSSEAVLRQRIDALEGALRRVVRDVNDYEEANKLSPNPGRSECWDSVAHAKAVLANPLRPPK